MHFKKHNTQRSEGDYMEEYKVCSLFCGAGGLDLGFKQAGYKILWANDFNRDSCATYRLHSPETTVVQKDISKIDVSTIPDCDVFLGGFPCQGYSLGGKRVIDDPRNKLYKEYVRIIKAKKPKCFIGENVKGILTLGKGEVLRQIIEDFSVAGYTVFYQLVNAKDFGVPQDRERVIITGFREDLNITDYAIPAYTGKSMNIGEALKDLPEPTPDEVYSGSFSPWFTMRNRRREFTDVSQTILATARQIPIHPSSPPMVKLGKDAWAFGEGGTTRRYSYKECAALQTFPKEIEFVGKLESKYRQIGNAVPVKLAYHIAKHLKTVLSAGVNIDGGEVLLQGTEDNP